MYQTDKQSNNKMIIIICIVVHMGIGSSLYFGVPIWYESPKTKCFDITSKTYYKCQEQEACRQFYKNDKINNQTQISVDYSQIIDYELSRDSLGLRYQLICENRQIQFDCINYINWGALLARIFNFSIRIKSNQYRKNLLIIYVSLMALSLWLQFLFDDIYQKSFILSIYAFARIAMHTVSIDMVYAYYNKKSSILFPMYQQLGCALYGVWIYPMNILVQGNYNKFILSDAIPISISTAIFIYQIFKLQPDHKVIDQFENYESINKHTPITFIFNDITDFFKQNSKKQFVIFLLNGMLISNMITIIYYLADGYDDSVQIIAIMNIFAFIGTFIAGEVQKKFNQKKFYFHSINIIILINLLTILLPFTIIQSNFLLKFILLLILILNNLIGCLAISQWFIMTAYYFSTQYVSILINGGFILDRILLSIMPKITYILKQYYDINVCILFGLSFLIINILNLIWMRHMKYENIFQSSIHYSQSQSVIELKDLDKRDSNKENLIL